MFDQEVKDGPTQKHPFGEEAAREAESLPITPDLCCCPYGPCKHYACLVTVDRERATGMRGDVHRICRVMKDDQGEWDLSEANIDRCSIFQPPLWRWVSWRQLWIVAAKLRAAQQRTSSEGPVTLPLRFHLALLLGSLLKWPLPTLSFLEGRVEGEE